MSQDNDSKIVARDETSDLISSAKVEGTAVYDSDGQRLGAIHHFMVGKRDGKVRFAVLSLGGLFGMGTRYQPLPWEALTYDTDKGGYRLNITRQQLEGGPSYDSEREPDYDEVYGGRIGDYYGGLL